MGFSPESTQHEQHIDSGVENNLERTPKKVGGAMRPAAWEAEVATLAASGSPRVSAAFLAGVVSLGAAALTDEAKAGGWSYGQTGNGFSGSGALVVGYGAPAAQIQIDPNSKHLGRDIGRAVVATTVINAINSSPNRPEQQKLRIDILPDAQVTMGEMGLSFDVTPFYIASMKNPQGAKINANERNLIQVRVTKAGATNVFVDKVLIENGRKVLQRTLVGVDQNGNLITAELARQPI